MEEEKQPLTDATSGENVETPVENVEVPQQEPVEKTYTQADVDKLLKGRFTQEQVNEMIKERLSRVKKNEPQTIEPSSNEELTRVKGDLASMQLKLAEYEKEVALGKYKINEQYRDFVDYKVLHMTDKDKDYATALEEFFADEANKKYLESEVKPPVPRPRNSNTLENGNATDNSLRANFGLAPKK